MVEHDFIFRDAYGIEYKDEPFRQKLLAIRNAEHASATAPFKPFRIFMGVKLARPRSRVRRDARS